MSADWQKKLVAKLRKWATRRFPLPFPVRCYLRPPAQMDNHLGFFDYDHDEDRGMIALCDAQGRECMIDTFLEEYAHARCWFLVDTEDTDEDPHHHATFWSEYGRLINAAKEVQWY